MLAPIVALTPAAGATVSSPARVSGTADALDATFQLCGPTGSSLRGGRRMRHSGTDITLVAYEASAKDGYIHVARVPVHVR